MPEPFQPMLATLAGRPFDAEDHLFEVKWDGVRTLAFCTRAGTELFSRTGRNVTHQYPEFSDLHSRLQVENAVLDGEIVALDRQGRPSFELLQQRINLSRPADIMRGAGKVQLDLVLFDLVFSAGEWRGNLPLEKRLELLSSSVGFGGRVLRSEPIPAHGIALFEAARERGLEGIVAKRISSVYQPGKRTRDWLKIKLVHEVECVIGGWTPGLGSRGQSLGALLVGLYDGEGALRFIGSVGTGFTDKTLAALRSQLGALEAPVGPFAEKVIVKGARWTRPDLVCAVEYREVTSALKLRAPSFKGLRPDKPAGECRLWDLTPSRS